MSTREVSKAMKVGIVGFGNMGSAFAKGLRNHAEVLVFDKDERKRERALQLGFGVAKGLGFLLGCDFLMIAVKPGDVKDVLESLKGKLKDEVLVSIVAGLNVESIKGMIGQEVRVIRSMPNIGVMVQEGAIAFCTDGIVDEKTKAKFVEVFSSCGKLYEMEERFIDPFTALASSGPAFVFKFVSALSMSGVMEGFSYETSFDIVLRTIKGSVELLLREGGHPEEWISKVASPGGTTIEGIKVLEERGFVGALMECVRKTAEKTKKL